MLDGQTVASRRAISSLPAPDLSRNRNAEGGKADAIPVKYPRDDPVNHRWFYNFAPPADDGRTRRYC